MSELPHPIIRKAAEAFPHEGPRSPVGVIASSTELQLWEVKVNQWRGGVWLDTDTGVHWLVVAGLAKGDHEDHDDIYKRIERVSRAGTTSEWLPTPADVRLLKRETAARILTEWELGVQQDILGTLRTAREGSTAQVAVGHPIQRQRVLATIEVSLICFDDPDYQADEISVEIQSSPGFEGSNLLWQLTTRALITLCPPVQDWDRYGNLYCTINERGYCGHRIAVLETLMQEGILAEAEPGAYAHYTHRTHLAGKTIEGKAVRALCGTHFVPTQDHEKLPCCPTCEQRLNELPQRKGSTESTG